MKYTLKTTKWIELSIYNQFPISIDRELQETKDRLEWIKRNIKSKSEITPIFFWELKEVYKIKDSLWNEDYLIIEY